MRTISQLGDNIIVEKLASFGYNGIRIDELSQLAVRLKIDDNWNGLEERLYEIYNRTNRVIRPNGDDRYAVSNVEWGRILEGKSAIAISDALDGIQ